MSVGGKFNSISKHLARALSKPGEYTPRVALLEVGVIREKEGSLSPAL